MVLSKDEAMQIGLASERVSPLPTPPTGNKHRSVMHGTLVQGMPHLNTDGFITTMGAKVYVGDVVMSDLLGEHEQELSQVPCRIVRSFFDEESRQLVVVVRCFRNANEVKGMPHGAPGLANNGLVRLWEEVGGKSEVTLHGMERVLGRIEVLAAAEVASGVHLQSWRGQGERLEGWSFVGEWFVHLDNGKFVSVSGRRKHEWRRAGGSKECFPNMRYPETNHSTLDLNF